VVRRFNAFEAVDEEAGLSKTNVCPGVLGWRANHQEADDDPRGMRQVINRLTGLHARDESKSCIVSSRQREEEAEEDFNFRASTNMDGKAS
jgi:hypothetical protein